jgi:hypothetical protein
MHGTRNRLYANQGDALSAKSRTKPRLTWLRMLTVLPGATTITTAGLIFRGERCHWRSPLNNALIATWATARSSRSIPAVWLTTKAGPRMCLTDYDNDGFLDLFASTDSSAQRSNFVPQQRHRMGGSVRCVGTVSNRTGIMQRRVSVR